MPSNELKTLVKRLNADFEADSNSCDCDVSRHFILSFAFSSLLLLIKKLDFNFKYRKMKVSLYKSEE